MAQQGLFTAGTSIEELLAKRNTRANALQQSLMANAAQGAARPMEAQAYSLLGSSLGRALAGSMEGSDKQMDALKAKNAEQKIAQGVYVDAMGMPTAAGMREQAAILRDTYPEASLKLLAAANVKDQAEKDALAAEAAAAKQDAKDRAALELAAETRAQDVKFKQDKIDLDADIRVEDKAEKLRKAGVDAEDAQAQAEAEIAKDKTTVMSAEDYNLKFDTTLPEGTFWKVKEQSGDLTQIAKPSKANVSISIPEGMNAEYDEKGNITKYVPIENGPQWLAAEKLRLEQEADEDIGKSKQGGRTIKNTVVSYALDSARRISKADSLLTPVFGKLNLAKFVGGFEGTERANMEATMKTLQAQSGFSTLQAMRDASKTGGALGAINAKEMELLTAALGSLDLAQSKEQFDQKLNEFEKVYYDTVNGSGAWDAAGKQTPTGGANVLSQDALKYIK
tara:strand:+ start:382 stop:1734 length:1353 start_codon:yes stop_codon:yes gene_type:complete